MKRGENSLAVRHGILGILSARPRHGYELKTEFDLLTGGLWDLNAGQIYSTLERLRKEGLVSLEEGEGDGEERKIYAITPDGKAELQLWLDRPPLKARPLRDELFVRLGLLVERDPAGARALLESQRSIYHLQMADLTRQKLKVLKATGAARLRQELLLDAALLHTEADLKWLEMCELKLERHGER